MPDDTGGSTSGLNAGTTDDAGSTGSGLPNLNDDDIGLAGLGAANIGPTTGAGAGNDITGNTVDVGNVSERDRTLDLDDDLDVADDDLTSSPSVGAGGDLSSPGIGTLDALDVTGSGSSSFDDDLGGPVTGDSLADTDDAVTGAMVGGTVGTLGAMGGLSETDDYAGVGSMIGSGIDPNLGQSAQQQPSAGNPANGKTVLVTGATSGIGRELANLFAKDGYNLVLVARSDDSLQQIGQDYEQQFGVRATTISRDLTDPNAAGEIYAETQRQGLTVDVLVNNAGVGEYGLFATDSDLQKELAIIQLNVSSLVHLTKLYLKDMVARNEGKILMLGSIASVMPNPLMAVYGGTKAFVYSFSEALRNELKDTNVTITVLMPPATDTDFFNKAGASHTVAQQQAHAMSPADVAKAGYDALMQGRDKVAAGLKTKLMAAASHFIPDQMVTQSARNLMKSQAESEQERKTSTLALVAGVAVIGGLLLLLRNRNNGINAYDKVRYGYKAGKAKRAGKDVVSSTPLNGIGHNSLAVSPLDSVVDSVKSTYHNAKAAVEEAVV